MNVLREYDNYILKNAAQISSIESSLRTITYILPSTLPPVLRTDKIQADSRMLSWPQKHVFPSKVSLVLTLQCTRH